MTRAFLSTSWAATGASASKALLRQSLADGRVVACVPVVCEVAAAFDDSNRARAALGHLHIEFEPLDPEIALVAADVFREYRRRGGKRTRVVADFRIGAHALLRADRLLTRDRGFHRSYFSTLRLLEPRAH
ncbi:MAG TPA: VapC toxin family PIN domain ribonuclease [Myxococcales bacterium]|nr:VapC toxin family PIN domain ribonuclease [Myxococcales bacterium]